MPQANPTRLLILGLLAGGPRHGHKIRRIAEFSDIERWGGVTVGSLYGMLHRLEEEGLIEEARKEQEGQRPARTIYAITEEGRQELALHRTRALTQPDLRGTSVEVALKWAAGLDVDELHESLALRRGALAALLDELRAGREAYAKRGVLPAASLAGYRRSELHLEAELSWHDELEAMLPAIAAEAAAAGGATPAA
jgi:DNA-binding PadR family transcriptional regulator